MKKIQIYFFYTLSFFFAQSSYGQSLNIAWYGNWVSDSGKSKIFIASNEFKFLYSHSLNETNFKWIETPPTKEISPELIVSADGTYKVCFYTGTITTRQKLFKSFSAEKIHQIERENRGLISLKDLNFEFKSINEDIKLLNNLSGDRFRLIACNEYLYTEDSKDYEEIGGEDVVKLFFYDHTKVYQCTTNHAVGGQYVISYSKK